MINARMEGTEFQVHAQALTCLVMLEKPCWREVSFDEWRKSLTSDVMVTSMYWIPGGKIYIDSLPIQQKRPLLHKRDV